MRPTDGHPTPLSRRVQAAGQPTKIQRQPESEPAFQENATLDILQPVATPRVRLANLELFPRFTYPKANKLWATTSLRVVDQPPGTLTPCPMDGFV